VKDFKLVIQDATGVRELPGVTSFVGEDTSGSFGILAGHARMIASLVIGLARFRMGADPWRYLALPGGVLYFDANVLTLSARRCLVGDDYARISEALEEQLLAEEHHLHKMKESLHRMEEEIFKRLWEMGRRAR
jgi:F-type H+-transporting ATPase subunit epsilon